MAKIIDLRSDTVTQPSEGMRKAMYGATVGDDFYFDDPTVLKLEEISAEKLGKEAGLFVPSGTMGNLVSILTHTTPGDSMIIEENAHLYCTETGHFSAVAGVVAKRIPGSMGALDPTMVEEAIIGEGVLYPTTRLIALENPHNAAGGTCISPEQMNGVKEIAEKYGLAIHLDGARIFNAAVALGVEPEEVARYADSIQFCLTKSLAAPFGSLVVGSEDFIKRARKKRQMVGGGMRQAGIMAAAGIYALDNMIERLEEDHKNARFLAEGVLDLSMDVDMNTVQTNMVYYTVPPSLMNVNKFIKILNDRGVLVNPPARNRVRMVTHYGITRKDIEEVLRIMNGVLSQS